MKSIKYCVLLFLILNSGIAFANKQFSEKFVLKYQSIEHYLLGVNLDLKFINDQGKIIIEKNGGKTIKSVLTTKGLYYMTFPQLIYLAGDFIANPTLNISGDRDINSYSNQELRNNFINNFNFFNTVYQGNYTAAKSYLVADFIPAIAMILTQELIEHQSEIKNHQVLSINSDLLYNCATGGGCDSDSDLITKKGLEMELSTKGGDHFGVYALTNYLTGHRLALETAVKAQNNDQLRNAYAYEAYADHFLTDSFAAGHLRTPIIEFMQLNDETELNLFTPILEVANLSKKDVLLAFAKLMHDTENKDGLWLKTTKETKPWRSYGDNSLFIDANQHNYKTIQNTIQHGVDQIFKLYQTQNHINNIAQTIDDNIIEMHTWLPDLNFVKTTNLNPTPPLFIINGHLYENGYRDWSNGSAGSVCVLARHLNDLTADQSLIKQISSIAQNYCSNTIVGFAKAWNWVSDNSFLDVSSVDGVISTQKIANAYHIKANTHNQQEVNVNPIVSDNQGNSCIFNYPIKLKRYGMYTSLDEADGNISTHRGVSIFGKEYLNCNNQQYGIYYQASALNQDNYFGLIKNDGSNINVEKCTDADGTIYLSNQHNNCKKWQ